MPKGCCGTAARCGVAPPFNPLSRPGPFFDEEADTSPQAVSTPREVGDYLSGCMLTGLGRPASPFRSQAIYPESGRVQHFLSTSFFVWRGEQFFIHKEVDAFGKGRNGSSFGTRELRRESSLG